MRYKRFDLNLLVALDALLATRSVSRAAERACVTQPAMSSALRRLRSYFRDPLLVPNGKTMMLTPAAKALLPALADLLRQVDSTILAQSVFDPKTSSHHFRVLVADTVLLGLLDERIRAAAAISPRVSFEFISPKSEALSLLESGEVDLWIAPEVVLSEHHPREHLFEEGHVVIACASNSLVGASLTLEEFASAGHVEVAIGGQRSYLSDEVCASAGVARRIEVIVDTFLQVPFHIRGTHRLATMPSQTATFFGQFIPLRTFEPPMAIQPVRLAMQWLGPLASDPALGWLRRVMNGTALGGPG